MSVAAMIQGWPMLSRRLQFQPQGGMLVELPGILRKPTVEELAGSADEYNRVAMFLHSDMEALGITSWKKFDRVIDLQDGHSYAVSDAAVLNAGATPVYVRLEVLG